MDLLPGVVHCAALDKLDHRVGKHFGVDAEILLCLQSHTGCVRYRTDAELDAGAVGDLLCDKVSDGDACLIQDHGRQNGQLVCILNNGVHLRDMELSAAQTAGLLLIYFDKDPLGLIDHRFRVGAVEGKAEITVAVHGRHGDAESVVLVFGTDMAGYIPVVCGEKIGIAAVYRLARTAGGKP